MFELPRRNLLGATAAGLVASASAATFGNAPPQGAINANAGGRVDPGQQNPTLVSQFPNATNPPANDIGDLPQFWASFTMPTSGFRTADGPVN
jgi:oxalate decarboxylase